MAVEFGKVETYFGWYSVFYGCSVVGVKCDFGWVVRGSGILLMEKDILLDFLNGLFSI